MIDRRGRPSPEAGTPRATAPADAEPKAAAGRTADTVAERVREIAASPVRLVAFGPAGDLLDVVGPRAFLHAGPPLHPSQTVGAMRGALIGALLLERQADSPEQADAILRDDGIALRPCHDAGGVGALAGVVSPTTPIALVESASGRRAFGTVVEGLGRALSFGNYDRLTLERVRWLAGEFCTVLNEAFARLPQLDVLELQAKALRRGDECHNRIVAATESLVARLAPALLAIGERAAAPLADLIGNPHFFLSLSIAAAKAIADDLQQQGPAGIVTAMTGNGRQCGIRVSGAPRPWYVHEAQPPTDMMLVEGRSEEDAAPLTGDSGVTETVGLGAFSLTSSLSLARVLGVDARGAAALVARMRRICVAEHLRYRLPADDFRGAPLGISVHAVAQTGITPAVNAGYAHRVPGEGRVGANLAFFPIELFTAAAEEVPAASPV